MHEGFKIAGAIIMDVEHEKDREDTAVTRANLVCFLLEEEVVMEAFLLTLAAVGLLISAGIFISVRFYARGALGIGRFRRIRRVRSLRPQPGGTGIEGTVEEIIEEQVPGEAETWHVNEIESLLAPP